ncbi:MAG: PAS domain-containing protein [Xanthobacteraceae bacterium]|nr:PAS domain-containing protein [Xanthobacteraceae bacterium]
MPENQLRLIQAIPEFFLDSLGIGLKLVDAVSREILLANKSFCSMLGVSKDEIAKSFLTFEDITYAEDRNNNLAQHSLLVAGKIEQYTVDKRYVRKDGSIFWGHMTAAPVRDQHDHVRWAVCVVEDVTNQKKLERNMAFAEKLSGLTTWNWDLRGSSSNHSSTFNTVFALPENVPHPTLDEFLERVHPHDRKTVKASVDLALAGGSYSHEYRLIGPDGSIRWLRGMASSVTNTNGEVTNIVGATIDVTDEKSRRALQLAPNYIRKIIMYMEANWNKPITNADIAKKSEKSSRLIHRYFAAHGTSPMRYLKKIRLHHAREMLSNPAAKTSVSAVSFKCCFSNLGHFAKDYKEEFGELPSATLARCRD